MGTWPGIVLVVGAVALGVWSLIPDSDPSGRSVGFLHDSGANPYQLERSPIERIFFPVLRRIFAPIIRISPAGRLDSLERKIALAGMNRGWTPERMLLAKAAIGAVCGLIAVFYFVSTGSSMAGIAILVAPVLGFMAPDYWMKQRGAERQDAIQRQLADVMDQFTIMVEAGISFDAAMDRVAHGQIGAISDEFARVVQDMGLGMNRREALDELAQRSDVDELHEFVRAMSQADAHGLSVGRVLKVQAAELRDKRRRRAEERAMKIPAKILIPLIFCVLPALLIVILGPGLLEVTSR